MFIQGNPFIPGAPNGDGSRWGDLTQFRHPDAINIYFVTSLIADEATASKIGGTDIVFPTGVLSTVFPSGEPGLDDYLMHTVGHCFSLYHTHEAISHFPDIPGNETIRDLTRCEKVNRIPNADPHIYNADIAGDEVTDTPAQPSLNDGNFVANCGAYIVGSSQQNCWLETYPSDITMNYMNCQGFSHTQSTNFTFTPGQIVRMRNFIASNTTDYSFLPGSDTARTDIAALYQPFDAEVIAGTVLSTEDQPENGGALVCRQALYRLRFQPGIKYEFSGTTSGTIIQDVNQQFNYNNTFGHSIGVKVLLLGDTILNAGEIEGVADSLCTFEHYISGTLYSMQVLGSMNITVDELNEIKVKDPNLYDELMVQYYYILKKITESGATTEKTFYKE